MGGTDFLADTNILIYLLKGNPAIEPYLESAIYVSVISEIELLGMRRISQAEITSAKNLLKDCVVVELTQEIKEGAILLKQNHKIKTPDAIIAATAQYLGIPLLSADAALKNISSVDLELVKL